MKNKYTMEKVKAYVSREKDGTYSIYVDDEAPVNYGLCGEGETVAEAMEAWESMYRAMRESYRADGMEFREAEFSFVYDVPSFLAYYGSVITFRGLAKLTGVSAAQLSQYATGYRTPSQKTTDKIREGLRKFAADLGQVALG